MLEEVVRAAALPAIIGGARRAQRDEAKPYLEKLRPFRAHFRQAEIAFAEVNAKSDAHTPAFAAFSRLAISDPYDDLATEKLRFYVAWGESEARPGLSIAKEIERLSCAAPRTPGLARNLASALSSAQRHAEARDVLSSAFESYGSTPLATDLLDQLYELDVPVDERLHFIEALPAQHRDQPAMLAARANLLLDAARFDEATEIFQSLSDPELTPEHAVSSCRALARPPLERGDWRSAVAQSLRCAERAPDRWSKAHDLVRAGRILRDFGDPERALALHRAALEEIGAASWIQTELGADLELLGRLDEARAVYERQRELYPNSDPAYLNLAFLHLRAGRPEDAAQVLIPMTRHGNDYLIYDALRSSAQARSELDAFEAEIRKRRGPGRLIALARSRLEDRQDAQAAIELLRPVVKQMPKYTEAMGVLGQAYLTAGDAASARGVFERALTADKHHWISRLGLVRSLLALGDTQAAEAEARRIEAAFPTGMGAAELWIHVHGAAGRWEAALASAERARSHYPLSGLNYPSREYWYWQQRLLLSELEILLQHPQHALTSNVIRDARRTLLRLPHAADLHVALATLLRAGGRLDEAQASFDAAARANPVRFANAERAPRAVPPATAKLDPR